MIILRDSSEEEMVLEFLKGELCSHRFRESILKALQEQNVTEELVTQGDLKNEWENAQRKAILGAFRGYPDRELFENYPEHVQWKFVEFEREDLEKLRYVSYSYWDELSKGTSKPGEAAKTVIAGREIFGASNQYFLDGRDKLLQGLGFPPIILLTDGGGTLLLLEGHCRATCYALVPERFAGTKGFVGFCDAEEFRRKEGTK